VTTRSRRLSLSNSPVIQYLPAVNPITFVLTPSPRRLNVRCSNVASFAAIAALMKPYGLIVIMNWRNSAAFGWGLGWPCVFRFQAYVPPTKSVLRG
jgi:hypothetical protein